LDFAAGVFDYPRSLESMRNDCYAGTSHTQHLRQIFLRKLKSITAR
jgi:hypothetical protein